MKKYFLTAAVLLLTVNLFAQEAKVGEEAPAFTLTDAMGEHHALSDYEGKYVVLEWINYGCPFVQKHYKSKNMQKLQEKYIEKDVVWLAINSSAEGKQGNMTAEEIAAHTKEYGANYSSYLIDEDGEVGKKYGAKTTPHMYVINPEGVLIYAGGIDDKATTELSDVEGATNYVSAALDESMSGKEVTVKTAKPYGCSVKYK